MNVEDAQARRMLNDIAANIMPPRTLVARTWCRR